LIPLHAETREVCPAGEPNGKLRSSVNGDQAIRTSQLADDGYVISLNGEFDVFKAPEFKKELLAVVGRGGRKIVVDLSATTLVDSTMLGALVTGLRRVQAENGRFALVCKAASILKIFETTRLDRVFAIYPLREEATAAVGLSVDGARVS
jgi:anti-sigma B factor antagonist